MSMYIPQTNTFTEQFTDKKKRAGSKKTSEQIW